MNRELFMLVCAQLPLCVALIASRIKGKEWEDVRDLLVAVNVVLWLIVTGVALVGLSDTLHSGVIR